MVPQIEAKLIYAVMKIKEELEERGEPMLQRILVIGCPGAGKSMFSRKLRDATGLPLHYLDMLWHKADKTNFTREEFDQKFDINIL